MSAIGSASVPPRSRDPHAIRRQVRFFAIARAAARFFTEHGALELARTYAGITHLEDLDIASIRAGILRRREHFGLEAGLGTFDAGAAAEAIFDAWRSAVA